jgi:hypothetical protein
MRLAPLPAQAHARSHTVIVKDLDPIRTRVWDTGTPITRRNGGADHIFRSIGRRSLWIRDPDGHELELAELS